MTDKNKRGRFLSILDAADTDIAHVLELARDFLADDPDHPGALLQLGTTLVQMARYNEARDVLRKLVPKSPPSYLPWVYAQLGHLYNRKGDHSRASHWFCKAIEVCPGEASLHIFLGANLAVSGKLDEALDAHRKAARFRKGPRDEAYFNIGLILRAKERYTDARRYLKKALAIDPKYRGAREALADVEAALDLIEERRKNRTSVVRAPRSR